LNGTFYFTHSEAVLPFLGLLGLYKDSEIPTHLNYETMKERNYSTSIIGSFSNNFGFVLYDCDGVPKVLSVHQEKPVKLELCDDLLCDWSQFQEIYQVLLIFVFKKQLL